VGLVSQLIPPSDLDWQFWNTTSACAWRAKKGIVSSSGDSWKACCRSWRINWDNGDALHSAAMYTDWTAVILLLLTAAPLAVVVGTAAFFIWNQKKAKRR
jgi:hypothetical protein